ncbi:MAG: hypothetical protein COC19_06695 [SAR86 cluster bacterium]|uniref:DUF2059 domain-containing protein n=1 Tax=SAR86 cluster bacterium TaxID=2030880 RepID=A0A2A4MJJ1_9GAMM|nr:MAG: hypothetical protein COC19_06695 [SAR86 cluster bacterium]
MKQALLLSLLLLCAIFGRATLADALSDANKLLRTAEIDRQMSITIELQIQNILNTYTSIIRTSASTTAPIDLPAELKQDISLCYKRVYAWENFEAGLAQILADNLSRQEMRLLINFYNAKAVVPSQIPQFKNTIAKAAFIQQLSADYIFTHSNSCVENDARLILNYLSSLDNSVSASE